MRETVVAWDHAHLVDEVVTLVKSSWLPVQEGAFKIEETCRRSTIEEAKDG